MKSDILEFLKLAQGPVKKPILLSHLSGLGYNITERKFRSIIEEMIVEDGFTIESSEQGYALITNEEQLERAMKYLKSKGISIFNRASCLNKNFYKSKGGNGQLSITEFFNESAI